MGGGAYRLLDLLRRGRFLGTSTRRTECFQLSIVEFLCVCVVCVCVCVCQHSGCCGRQILFGNDTNKEGYRNVVLLLQHAT